MNNMDKIYLDMINKSPIPCLLGGLVCKCGQILDLEIEYLNIKMIELLSLKNNSFLQNLGLSSFKSIEKAILKLEDNTECSLDLYIPSIDKYYNISINKLENNKICIWFTSELSLLCRCEKNVVSKKSL